MSVSEGGRGRFLLDTNILVYTVDHTAPRKMELARRLVEDALVTGRGLVSYQVVQEFLNVATRRFARPFTTPEVEEYLEGVLWPLCRVFPSVDLYGAALDVADRWGYSFYDSLIVAAALEAGCTALYSEDLQHGQVIGNLSIIDPFKAR